MITLLILFAVIATGAVTISLGLLALVVCLWKSRRKALVALDQLSNGYQALLVERAYRIARDEAAKPLWVNKNCDTIH